eukprot:CAMPEP_0198280140 /NCGR_PEP_ID=MMETSP1449-20131203/289_1 /TAXON_ID=420275 /ORGANISM="Attheya septentrionalis, Strain CCMP2084" /LENGTH=459 /DNA_ID=CAMNT_0043975423 /DNA_START=100 /DNA_END=1475 /DNA_ORIENTATION=-
MYSLLKAYKELYGHCLVPNRCEFNKKLGIWVSTQRKDMKKLKMQPEREELLRLIGFSWETVDPRHVAFSERIQLLTKFKEENGHCKVPTKCEGTYKKLGVWVDRQRQQYKHLKATEEAGIKADPGERTRSTSITAEEIRCLEDLGFEWEVVRGGRGPNTSPPKNLDPDDILDEPNQFSDRSWEGILRSIARDLQNESRETLLSGLTSSNGAGPDFGSDNSNPKMGDSSKIEEPQQESIPEKKQIDCCNIVSNRGSEEMNHNVIEDENDTMIFGHISHIVPKDVVTPEFLSGLDDTSPDLKNSLRSTSSHSLVMPIDMLTLGSSRMSIVSMMSIVSTAQFDNERGGDVVITAEAESPSPPSRDFMKLQVEQKKETLARLNAHNTKKHSTGPNISPRNSGNTAEGEIEKLVKTPENLVLDDILFLEPIQFSERSQEIIAREHQNKSRETLLSGLTSSNGAG